MIRQRCVSHRLEGLRAAGTQVEDAGYAVFPEPQVHCGNVAHVNEVALKAVAAFEQFRAFAVIQLGVQVERHARHAAFVAFARSVHVEVTEADDLRVRFRQHLTHVLVEQEFGVTVDVQRLFILAGFDKVRGAAAVGCRGGGIQERNFTLQAVVQELFGVLIVIVHHVLAVPLGGGRTRTFVEDGFDLAELFACHNLDKEVFFIHVVSDVQIHQVDELGAVFQVVNHQDVGDAFVIESLNNIAADKARAAGNDDHNCNL